MSLTCKFTFRGWHNGFNLLTKLMRKRQSILFCLCVAWWKMSRKEWKIETIEKVKPKGIKNEFNEAKAQNDYNKMHEVLLVRFPEIDLYDP